MIPIYEQGNGRGIGLGLKEFQSRFLQLCQEHANAGRAKAFALILYDFTDEGLRKILENQSAFTKLDRLAGRELSIFYLHSPGKTAAKAFNDEFLRRHRIEQKVQLPAVIFFRVDADGISDITIAELETTDLETAFHDLYSEIDHYKNGLKSNYKGRAIRWITATSGQVVATAALETAIAKLLQYL